MVVSLLLYHKHLGIQCHTAGTLLCPWILWIRNPHRVQQEWLMSTPQCQDPQDDLSGWGRNHLEVAFFFLILILFYIFISLVAPLSLQDLRSLTRD